MCEFSDWSHKNQALQYFRGGQIYDALPSGILARFPSALRENCCPKCGRYLQDWERRPQGRASRSMCREDYDRWIARRIDAACFVCGMPLQNHKVQAQYQNPREVEHHIHEGVCKLVWTVLHNVALGEPDMVRAFGMRVNPQPMPLLDEGFGDFIDAEFSEELALPWEPLPRALPAPAQWPQPLQQTHKGKPVRTVR